MSVIYQGGGSASSTTTIPEYTTDPISPLAGDTWVLRTPLLGSPIGLLLALTHPVDLYQISYRTLENTTVRATLA